RRLPRAARPEDRRERALRDLERDVVEGEEGAEALRDVADLDRHLDALLRLGEGHQYEYEHGDDGKDDGYGVGAAWLEVLDHVVDERSGRLGLPHDPARNDGHGSVLAEATRRREDDAVDHGP